MIEYIVFEKYISRSERNEREMFLKAIFNFDFISIKHRNYYSFKSIPLNKTKILILFGHNFKINNFLAKYRKKIDTLIIISCKIDEKLIEKLNISNVYVTYNENQKTDYFDGSQWGFNYEITKEEIRLYNNRKLNILDNINKCFRRLQYDRTN